MPPQTWQGNPVAVGQGVSAVVLHLDPRPGDTITLLGAEAITPQDGATYRFHASPPVSKPDGTQVIGERLEPLEGFEIRGMGETDTPDDTVGVVAEMTAAEPGRFDLRSVRLRYRLNDGPELVGEGIDVAWTVCADDPAPKGCEPATD
jgi:hypothetical protein